LIPEEDSTVYNPNLRCDHLQVDLLRYYLRKGNSVRDKLTSFAALISMLFHEPGSPWHVWVCR